MPTEPSTSTPTVTPTDSSPYIRTYAKDLAALSGKSVVQVSTPPGNSKANEDRHQILKDQAEGMPEVDESLVTAAAMQQDRAPIELDEDASESALTSVNPQYAAAVASSTEPDRETLPAIEEGDIVQTSRPVVAAEPVPHFEQQNPIASEQHEREGILARLRAKVAHHEKESVPVQTPVSLPPPPEPMVQEYVPPRPSVLPVTISSAPLYTPPQAPIPTEQTPSPFHSFSTDFSDRVTQEHASAFSVLAAEKDAHPPVIAKRKVSLVPIALGVVLILLGTFAVGGVYLFTHETTAPVVARPIPSLIAADQTAKIMGTGGELLGALSSQALQPVPENSVVVTYISVSTTTKDGTTETPLSGGALFAALQLPAPDILLRNISDQSTVGVVHAGSETRPFFLLKVSSYERTYAGMLAWEPTIFHDLAQLYPPYPVQPTASTTVGAVSNANPLFRDEVIANHNVRVLRDTQGQSIVLYGYGDATTLIIARDPAAFTLLLARLQANGS